jgi:hypothetical protein
LEAPISLPFLLRHYIDTAKYTMFGDDLLTDDEAQAIFLYSCEWAPRQLSLYYLLNLILRDKDRSKALPFLPYIKLLCTALCKVIIQACCRMWVRHDCKLQLK